MLFLLLPPLLLLSRICFFNCCSQIVTVPLLSFIDLVVNQVIVGMLLWPKRITVR